MSCGTPDVVVDVVVVVVVVVVDVVVVVVDVAAAVVVIVVGSQGLEANAGLEPSVVAVPLAPITVYSVTCSVMDVGFWAQIVQISDTESMMSLAVDRTPVDVPVFTMLESTLVIKW